MKANRSPICGGNDSPEDEKMEKFFALIRNFKEARDRQRIVTDKFPLGEECDEDLKRRKKKLKVGDPDQSIWIPAFKWEDFTENVQAQLRRSPVIDVPASNFNLKNKIGNPQDDTKRSPPKPLDGIDGGLHDLDLKLRL